MLTNQQHNSALYLYKPTLLQGGTPVVTHFIDGCASGLSGGFIKHVDTKGSYQLGLKFFLLSFS